MGLYETPTKINVWNEMKILILSSYYVPDVGGGAEYVVKQYAELLSKKGNIVEVLVLTDSKVRKQEMVGEILVTRIPIKNLYFPLNGKPNKILRLFWHIIDSYNPFYGEVVRNFLHGKGFDVVICHSLQGWSAAVWKIFSQEGIPIVQVIHDYYFLCPNCNMAQADRKCDKQCLKCRLFTIKSASESKAVDSVIYISNCVKSKIEAKGLFKRAKSAVVYNAINCPSVSEPKLNNNVFSFGFIGTISPVKGVTNLIKAFKRLTGKVELLIAGKFISKDYENFIKKLVAGDCRIKFLGYVKSDVFFRSINVAVFPAIWEEPFGLVALESCANKTPCIVSNFGGMTEIVRDGINGLYCNPFSIMDICHKMQLLCENTVTYKKMQDQTIASVSSFLRPEEMIEKVENICRSIIK